jgi:hypothetical protein
LERIVFPNALAPPLTLLPPDRVTMFMYTPPVPTSAGAPLVMMFTSPKLS